MFSKTSSTPQSNKPLKRYIPESATGGVLWKKVFLKFRKIHSKIPVPESLFCATLLKGVFLWILRNF